MSRLEPLACILLLMPSGLQKAGQAMLGATTSWKKEKFAIFSNHNDSPKLTTSCLRVCWCVLGLLGRSLMLASGRWPSTFAQALSNIKYNWRPPSTLYKGLLMHCQSPAEHVIVFLNSVQVSGFAFQCFCCCWNCPCSSPCSHQGPLRNTQPS